ncbi:MAG: hypothetical protein ACJAVA_000193 [Flavobacteriaceae bacterium]|jgi:hypothetical protein
MNKSDIIRTIGGLLIVLLFPILIGVIVSWFSELSLKFLGVDIILIGLIKTLDRD